MQLDFASCEEGKPFHHVLLPILRNKLTLIRNAKAGKGWFEDHFLCGEIEMRISHRISRKMSGRLCGMVAGFDSSELFVIFELL